MTITDYTSVDRVLVCLFIYLSLSLYLLNPSSPFSVFVCVRFFFDDVLWPKKVFIVTHFFLSIHIIFAKQKHGMWL